MRHGSCPIDHRKWHTLVECQWPGSIHDGGRGPIALLAHCDVLTVSLHETLESAERAKARIDYTGCGGRCQRRHEIVRLEVSR